MINNYNIRMLLIILLKANLMEWNILRKKCKRKSDYIITLFITNEISLVLTKVLLKTKITPNQVTLASIICGLACGIFYAFGWLIIGSIFLFVSHILDCTDGNLARAKEQFSDFGRWLDFIGNRIAEVFVFLGVSFYFYRNGSSEIWIVLPILGSQLLLLYYYIVDVALSLGITKTTQDITSIKFKDVHVKWGLMEPVLYGFILLAPFGFIKIQILLVIIYTIAGLFYQMFKMFFPHWKRNS